VRPLLGICKGKSFEKWPGAYKKGHHNQRKRNFCSNVIWHTKQEEKGRGKRAIKTRKERVVGGGAKIVGRRTCVVVVIINTLDGH